MIKRLLIILAVIASSSSFADSKIDNDSIETVAPPCSFFTRYELGFTLLNGEYAITQFFANNDGLCYYDIKLKHYERLSSAFLLIYGRILQQ